jgi:hypothetical protein
MTVVSSGMRHSEVDSSRRANRFERQPAPKARLMTAAAEILPNAFPKVGSSGLLGFELPVPLGSISPKRQSYKGVFADMR